MMDFTALLEQFSNWFINFDKDAFFEGLTKAFEMLYSVLKPFISGNGAETE